MANPLKGYEQIDKIYCLSKHFADVVEEELEFDLIKYSKLKRQIEA